MPAAVSVTGAYDGVEGRRDAMFLVHRDDAAGSLTINYTLATNTGPGTAFGSPAPGSLTVASGQQVAEVAVPAPDNALRDGVREVALSLVAGTGYTVDQAGPDVLAIGDDEPADAVWIDSTLHAIEGESAGYIRLRRFDTSGAESIHYSFESSGSTATQGVDFANLSGVITFAPGQATADVVIDPTGAYADALTEGEELVSLTFNMAEGPVVQAVAIADARPANRAPAFTVPGGGARYDLNLGEGQPKGAYLGQVGATDADNDDLTFTITGGTHRDLYEVDKFSGWIWLKDDMALTAQATQSFNVTVSDGRLTTAIEVRVTLRPLVFLTGDYHGVEAPVGTGRDRITLEFRRRSHDVSAALTANYAVTWGTAGRQDLDNPDALVAAGQTSGSVTFAAGQELVTITLTPRQDRDEAGGGREDLETFTVEVVDSAPSYVSVVTGVPKFNKLRAGMDGVRKAVVSVLDEVTLFAGNNVTAALADPAGGNGANVNDAIQGNQENCFFIAGIGALARNRPADLAAAMQANANGTVTVGYYLVAGGPRREVTVSLSLDDGLEQAKLSMDYTNNDKSRAYEIWSVIAEKAYRAVYGNAVLKDGGRTVDVWTFFTGQANAATSRVLAATKTAAQVATEITAAFNAGRMVAICTHLTGGSKPAIGANQVYMNHAYVLTSIQAGQATFYNPWGNTHITVLLAELRRYLYYYSIL